jgi:hypothetical protein
MLTGRAASRGWCEAEVQVAGRDVTVSKLCAKPGDSLAADAVIVEFALLDST